ncbi:MAG TPA: hypothetical protein VNB68_04030, partial [Nitrososphaeraceae archaeon]|nr:hypothetical protein [Nitrososphaeraceae archaeon]
MPARIPRPIYRKMKHDVFKLQDHSLCIAVGNTRAGVSTIILSRRLRLCKTGQYCIAKKGPVVVVITLLMIIITTPTILQPALTTASNLSANTTNTDDAGYNSFTLIPSNQSTTSISSSVEKTNVTLRGLFNVQVDPGRWNQLLQPALDELNRRHPDMNIELEYTEFFYPGTRNQIVDRLSKGETVDI